jgi:hypothetical protein
LSRSSSGLEAFTLHVDDAVLDDLRQRLERTRFARPTPGPEGAAGISLEEEADNSAARRET